MAINPFQVDLHRLAVGILYLNLGRAKLDFPTRSRSHPSYTVLVSLSAPESLLRDSDRSLFPIWVRWDVWERVVVPLFADGSVLVRVLFGVNDTLRHQINREMLRNNLDELITKIEQAVLRGYEEQGFVLSSATTEEYIALSDPPLVYERDTELAAAALQELADSQAEAVWEASLDESPPVTPVVPATPVGSSLQVTVVVPLLPGPGEVVVRPGTVETTYQKFDV